VATAKLRPGIKAKGEFPTTPSLLKEKTYKRVNILVGDDPMQIRFAEQTLGAVCEFMAIVGDEHVLGKETPVLFRIDSSRNLDLSPNVRAKVGIWSLDPIEKGSDGANAIVKHAAIILGMTKPHKDVVRRIADEIAADDIYDVRAALWEAMWRLTDPKLEVTFKPWLEPWENVTGWLPEDVDPSYRLNSLYWKLVKYIFAKTEEDTALKKIGKFSPTEFKRLRELKLDLDAVNASIYELSSWRTFKSDPYICALKISTFWKNQ
jgi:hypothetical protein